jgi:thioredoxin-related protein
MVPVGREGIMKKYLITAFLFCTLVTGAQEVEWLTFEEAIALNKKQPKKIIVDVYTDWCGYCKIMDKNTFADSVVAVYMNTAYYPVKFNAEQSGDVTLNETTYKFVAQGARGYHELAAALLQNQLSYPSIVFLDEQTRIIHIQKGFVQAKPFDEIIKFIGGDHYKSVTWDVFKSTYNSPVVAN